MHTQRLQIKSLRRRFSQVDEGGEGVLSKIQFSKMLENVGIYLTAGETESIRERFDHDGDGRVDLLNFLNFFLSRENKERRSVGRVTRGLEALHEDALHMQMDKLKKLSVDNIDSSTAWKDMKKRHTAAYKKAFPGFLTVDDFGQALERLNVRLSQRELRQLVVRMAPLGNGHVNEEDFHRFVCLVPRTSGQILRSVERDALPDLVESYRSVRHSQHRKDFKGTVAMGSTLLSGTTPLLGTAMFRSAYTYQSLMEEMNWREAFRKVGPSRTCTMSQYLPGRTSRPGVRFGATSGRGGPSMASPTLRPAEIATDIWNTEAEDPVLRETFSKNLEAAVKAVNPDDQDMTTIEHIADGLAALGEFDRSLILDSEWALLAQLVGADEAEHNVIDAHGFLEGLCAECLEEHETQGVTLEDISATEEEALNLVCEDLVKMINEEARTLPENGKGVTARSLSGGGDDSGGNSVSMDYSKPFKLFDEKGEGVIPIDDFRSMLYRLHVNSLLRERQVVELLNRFDIDRTGEITLKDFIAFAKKETWGENALTSTGKDGEGALEATTKFGLTFHGFHKDDDGDDQDDGEARFHGLRVTGSKQGDALAVSIMQELRKSFEGKPGTAKTELVEGLGALDYHREGKLPATTVITALRRMGLELHLQQKEMELALRVFEVRKKRRRTPNISYSQTFSGVVPQAAEESGKAEVDCASLVGAVGRAWRAVDLHSNRKSLTG
ncbi:unnamed protein product, partial [Choristocarpus tenellus]